MIRMLCRVLWRAKMWKVFRVRQARHGSVAPNSASISVSMGATFMLRPQILLFRHDRRYLMAKPRKGMYVEVLGEVCLNVRG